jgi:ribosomal protein S19
MRSTWKLPFLNFRRLQEIKKNNKEYKKNQKNKKKNKKKERPSIILKNRADTINPDFIKNNLKIYNGIKYIFLPIRETHIGYKCGHFTVTKKRCIFRKTKLKKNKKKIINGSKD